jgi:hypothetical protein
LATRTGKPGRAALTIRSMVCNPARAGKGISAAVVDLATPMPYDAEIILASAAKTGRCVIVHAATHGTNDVHRNRLLARPHGIGAKPARALQRYRLEVESACEHHGPIEGEGTSVASTGTSANNRPSGDKSHRRSHAKACAHRLGLGVILHRASTPIGSLAPL